MNWDMVFQVFMFLIAAGVGMGSGSYCTMIYYRSNSGEPWGGKWTGKKAYCPKCEHKLRTRDLLPLFNWLINKGRCHFCSAKVNPVYFFIELSTTILSVAIWHKHGFDQYYILTFIMACSLVVLAATSYSYSKLPDSVLMIAAVTGLIYRALADKQIYDMIITMASSGFLAVGYLELHRRLVGRKIKNFGYLKLFAISGIWLGFIGLLHFISILMPVLFLVFFMGRTLKLKKSPLITIPLSLCFFLEVLYPGLFF